jgi:hypothetical protein
MNDNNPNLPANENNFQTRSRLYTLQEAADILRRKPNWLYTKTKDNSIPHRRFGKYIVFTESDINTIITMSSRGPNSSETLDPVEE